MSMCIGKNNVYVIFAMINMMNDDLRCTTYVVLYMSSLYMSSFVSKWEDGRENDT